MTNNSVYTRREFMSVTMLGALGTSVCIGTGHASELQQWDPDKPLRRLGRPLRVQPVLMYKLPTPRPQTSWKSWGGVQTEDAVADEASRITRELDQLQKRADFPLNIRPVVRVNTEEAAIELGRMDQDLTLLYACTGGGNMLRACLSAKPDTIVFVRHRSGPVYYWYEALSTAYLKTGKGAANETGPGNVYVDDVVVDDQDELLWRLRATGAVHNTRGTRIVALGGAWGKYAPDAPDVAKRRFGIEIVDVGYEDFERRIRELRNNSAVLSDTERWTRRYLSLPGTRLATDRRFVVNSFVLYLAFKELLEKHAATAFTIKSCMGTVIPMSETTACLTLALLNDEGLAAFCESDFVIIPAGLLLRHLSGKPVFLHNSTFPHKGTVTCAHCTCPRRLDGRKYEPARIVTHYESEYGAAPKVQMPIGQLLTFIDPQYSTARWVGFTGKVRANPDYEICRSQQDVEIEGHWRRLVDEVRDSHWVAVYGNCLREAGYAARKFGIEFEGCDA